MSLHAPQLSTDTLVHLGFFVFLIAFLVRDVLWLRVLAMLAYTVHILRVELMGHQPFDYLMLWYATFVAINAGHAAWLIYERRLTRLSAAERNLATLAFPALDRGTLKRLLRAGNWRRLEAGEQLTWYGARPEILGVILSGRIAVRDSGETIASIGPGHFIGEMSFITGAPATADTIAEDTVRLFQWDQETLARRCERDPALQTAIYTALGPDLVQKVAATRVNHDTSGAPQGTGIIPARVQHGTVTAYTVVVELTADRARVAAGGALQAGERAAITLSGLDEPRQGTVATGSGELAELRFDTPLDLASLDRIRGRQTAAQAA